jgi:hypothetical protein
MACERWLPPIHLARTRLSRANPSCGRTASAGPIWKRPSATPALNRSHRTLAPIDRADGIALRACKPVQCLTYEPDRLTLSNSNRPGTAQNARLRNSVLDPPTAHLSRADRGCGGTGTTSTPKSSRRNRPHISSKIRSANSNLVYH